MILRALCLILKDNLKLIYENYDADDNIDNSAIVNIRNAIAKFGADGDEWDLLELADGLVDAYDRDELGLAWKAERNAHPT